MEDVQLQGPPRSTSRREVRQWLQLTVGVALLGGILAGVLGLGFGLFWLCFRMGYLGWIAGFALVGLLFWALLTLRFSGNRSSGNGMWFGWALYFCSESWRSAR